MTTAHVLDLIEHALDDCAVSNDAVRYNAPASAEPYGRNVFDAISPDPPLRGNAYYLNDSNVYELMQELGRQLTRLLPTLVTARRYRLRRMHTAHPARWRKP